MNKNSRTGTLILMALLVLALALPTLAKMPDRGDMGPMVAPSEPEPEPVPVDAPVVVSEASDLTADSGLSWSGAGSTPGFYAARDWRNMDATTHSLVGGHQSFYWDQLNPSEGSYNWAPIEAFLSTEIAAGKKPAFGIITFNGRANEGNASDPPIRVPDYVFAAGADKITCGDDFQIPKYWDPVYMAKYTAFVNALAAQYDGDPRVEFIQIAVGKFGETQPCDDADDAWVEAALQADGWTMYSWPYMVMDITAIYDNAFSQTKLYLPNAPTFKSDKSGFKLWTDDAISRGVGVFPAGLMAIQEAVDYRPKAGWEGYGKFDQILDHIEGFEAGTEGETWVPISQEAYHYMTPSAVEFYWAMLGALRRRVDHVTLEHNLLYDGETPRADFTDFIWTMQWASQYMGKSLSEAPSAWCAMREAGYRDNWYPQKGNYTYWLYQDDSVPGGQTRVSTYRVPRDLVHHTDYDYHGEAATVRAEIEHSVTALGGLWGSAKEGWITRRTDQGTGNRYMALKLDDRYAYGGPRSATITVTYFDGGTDTWQLLYDAVGNPNQVAGTITKQNTGIWKKAVFTVADAAFTNAQTGGTDLRIDCMNDGNEYIHMVDVDTDGGGVTPTPSATTDPDITPSATASPSITPTPSITPRVTNTPVVVDMPANMDTYLSSYYPDDNYGDGHRLVVRMNVGNSLIGFDTSSIPTNATITNATLHLYLDWYEHQIHLTPNVSAYKVKQSWLEDEATWNDRVLDTGWAGLGATGAADRDTVPIATSAVSAVSSWYTWDITSLAQDWVYSPSGNQGLLLESDSGRELRFHSSEFSSQQPYLHIEYNTSGTAPSPTPTVTRTGTPDATPGTVTTFRGASMDTYLDSSTPDDNKENEWLHVQGPGWRRTLIDFAISGDIPAGSQVVSATLKLTSSYPGDGRTQGLNVDVFKVNRAWMASQATYNEALTGQAWSVPGCDGIASDREGTPADTQWVQEVSTGSVPTERIIYGWDVTSIVQDWVNDYASQHGMMLFASDPGSAYRDLQFYDTSYQPGGSDELVPVLQVEWSTGPITPTPTMTRDASKGNVEGTVYNDDNMDGGRQVGELGVLGATVQLKSGQSVLDTYVTTGSGEYSFANAEVGSYSVEVIPPTGYLVSTTNPYPVTVTGGSTSQADFGVYSAANMLFLPVIRK